VGIGQQEPEALLSLREIGKGKSSLLFLRRAEADPFDQTVDASQNVSFILDPTAAVFNLDVSGSRNSRARMHLGDPDGPDNPVTTLGSVGIGTIRPREKLEVVGNVIVSGDIKLVGGDCAEEFDIVDERSKVEPGNVMVIGDDGRLCVSQQAYDKRVAGIVAGTGRRRPGIVLGKSGGRAKRVPIALLGKVLCWVDATYAAIGVGDLLATSPTRGHAMKATDPGRSFGAVVGKALAPLASGQKRIPVLIALQ
jgi:hypothetical protein